MPCRCNKVVGQVGSPSSRRAWVEMHALGRRPCRSKSPSSRRAWVEISGGWPPCMAGAVALLAEGVGRNSISSDFGGVRFCRRPPRGGRG